MKVYDLVCILSGDARNDLYINNGRLIEEVQLNMTKETVNPYFKRRNE